MLWERTIRHPIRVISDPASGRRSLKKLAGWADPAEQFSI